MKNDLKWLNWIVLPSIFAVVIWAYQKAGFIPAGIVLLGVASAWLMREKQSQD